MKRKLCFIAIFALLLAVSAPAQAGQPRMMSSYEGWAAYVFTEDGNKVCYMASKPKNENGDYTKRGETFALVTHRPAEGSKNVFSYIAGYDYKPGSDAVVMIDDQKFVLFTQGDTAWAPDANTDEKLAEALRQGTEMVVTGTSARGTETKDIYELKGTSKAYDRISAECRS